MKNTIFVYSGTTDPNISDEIIRIGELEHFYVLRPSSLDFAFYRPVRARHSRPRYLAVCVFINLNIVRKPPAVNRPGELQP